MRPVTVVTTDASGGAKAAPPIPLDIYQNPFNVSFQAIVTGTVNYDVQYTNDDIWAAGYNPATGNWADYTTPDFSGETASKNGSTTEVVRAVRLLQNTGDGSVRLTVVQSGLQS